MEGLLVLVPRATLIRIRSLRLAALVVGMLACAAIGAAPATAAGSCAASHSTKKWQRGSVVVYAKHVKRGLPGHKYVNDIYTACSTRYQRRIPLEPDAYSGFTSFVEFRTNARYLYYTVQFEGPVDGAGRIGRMVDLKSGRTTRTLPAPMVTGATTVPCDGFEGECIASVVSSAIEPDGPGFALATSIVGGTAAQPVTYHRIRVYCPNRAITGWTASEVEFGVGAIGPKTLHTDGSRFRWKIYGDAGSAPFC